MKFAFKLMVIIAVILGLDILAFTAVLNAAMQQGGMHNSVSVIIVYLAHIGAFIGACAAAYEIREM